MNVGLDYYKRQSRKPLGNLVEDGEEQLAKLSADALEEEARQTAVEEAQFLLRQAPPEDRSLLTLLYLNEMSIAEVAEHFGWSTANAKIKAFRARKRLKSILEKHDYQLD